jgi:peptidyl-dipeptidase Dcp
MGEHSAEIKAIAEETAEPSFANTIAALEKSGERLDRVSAVFFNLAGADTSDALQAIEREMAPLLSRHSSEITLNPKLFRRIAALYDKRGELGLGPEESRVLERYYTNYSRAGGGLEEAGKKRLAEINERLAVLGTQFAQNVLADEKAYTLVLDGEADLAGLPPSLRAAAAEAARARGHGGKHVITLSRSSIEPFLQFSKRRDLREKAFQAWIRRGENGGATDNRGIIGETVKLRAERAKLLGYESFADYKLADTMAKTPAAAIALLDAVWTPARQRAAREADDLQRLIAEEGGNHPVAPWDWRYYAEQMRKRRFDFDDGELKPYLQLDKVIEAAFYVAGRLFGLSFTELTDAPAYHPDVRVFAVSDKEGNPVGLFLGDYFARPSKRSGAWMSGFRDQQRLAGDIRPIIVNVMNFAKPGSGQPALLSFDDARTLFHEFGHGLHHLLTRVDYSGVSGIRGVEWDAVELPSQFMENFCWEWDVLAHMTAHVDTGAPLPRALFDKMVAAKNFQSGMQTVRQLEFALFDMHLHDDFDAEGVRTPLELLDEVRAKVAVLIPPPFNRFPHSFAHIFAGGYSAGYYSYKWAEVLSADAYSLFEERGVLDPHTGARFRDEILAVGGSRPALESFKAFRGREPSVEPLLRHNGMVA